MVQEFYQNSKLLVNFGIRSESHQLGWRGSRRAERTVYNYIFTGWNFDILVSSERSRVHVRNGGSRILLLEVQKFKVPKLILSGTRIWFSRLKLKLIENDFHCQIDYYIHTYKVMIEAFVFNVDSRLQDVDVLAVWHFKSTCSRPQRPDTHSRRIVKV